jgi:(p)ppGpp synthase/HD superfamily hydrolase
MSTVGREAQQAGDAELVALCDAIAAAAHAGQVDKSGAPYVEHPRRVAARCKESRAKAAALLHDVLEDCPEWTTSRLIAAGVPDDVVDAVVVLSKQPGVTTADYLKRIALNPLALRVKLADIADNTDPQRMAKLRETDPATADRLTAKYANYRQLLAETRRTTPWTRPDPKQP